MRKNVTVFGALFMLSALTTTPTAPLVLEADEAVAAKKQAKHPNIIFILTDDLDADSIPFMPRLNSLLVNQGTTFQNYFVNVSLCCPSRAATLRGQYSHNTEILTNQPPNGGFEQFHALGREDSTVATWLHAAGYRTVLLGKYLNGYPEKDSPTYVPPGWDEWYSPAGGTPYSNYSYTLNENGKLVPYGERPEDYLTDVLAGKANDFIKRAVADNKPFFVYLATYAPHSPATPAPRHEGMFPNATAPRSPSFNERNVSDKPEYIRDRPLLGPKEIQQIDDLYRKRLQSLQAVDEMIAGLIDTLKASGQLENTYIFFTSDNGFHLGQHRLAQGKTTAYEEDVRVTLIVRGPGVPAGRVLEHLTGNVDLAPTWAELGGASVPDFVDGRSLVPLLGSNPPATGSWRQAYLIEHWTAQSSSELVTNGLLEPPDVPQVLRRRQQQRLGVPQFQALHTKNLLYVEYVTGERELYDLRDDPYELQNILATTEPSFVPQFASRLEEMRHCVGATCRAAEGAPLSDSESEVKVQRDVIYGVVQGQALKLDIYKPELPGPLPAIMFVHGGGWTGGDKRGYSEYGTYFAQRGYVGFSVNYRLAPRFKFPAQIEDVKCAVRWVRAHATELNVNPDRIGAMGVSAGGHLVGLLGVTSGSEGLEGACGDPTLSSRVKAVVPYAGPMDLTKLFSSPVGARTAIMLFGETCEATSEPCKKASPITYVSADDSPFLLVHGTQDPLVPFEQPELMQSALKEVGVPVDLVPIEGAGHAWTISSRYGQQALARVVPFFECYLKK